MRFVEEHGHVKGEEKEEVRGDVARDFREFQISQFGDGQPVKGL